MPQLQIPLKPKLIQFKASMEIFKYNAHKDRKYNKRDE